MPAVASTDSQRLAALLRSVAEAILVTDPAGVVTLANPAAETLFRLTAEAVAGQALRLSEVDRVLGDWLERAIAEKRAQSLVFEMKLGEDRHFMVDLAPLRAEDGSATGWMAVLKDVTHLKNAEQWKSEAIESAAHDLRNPLNTLKGALGLLDSLLRDPTPDQQECVNMIRVSVERISALTEQLLNLEHAEGGADMVRAHLTLRQVLEAVVEEFKLLAEGKQIRLEFAGEPATALVLGDAAWLHRAAANLVSNAVKYTPEGGRVVVGYREAGGMGIVEVTDTGPGIPREAQARLFERFYRVRTEATRRAPGTGLGLAIVKTIVERHGGQVWVSSEEGQGSTFGFAVPLVK